MEWPLTLPGGYAGYYTTQFDGVVIRFVDPIAGQATVPNAKFLDDLGVSSDNRKYVGYERVKWSLAQLWDWYDYLMDAGPLVEAINIRVEPYRNSIVAEFQNEPSRDRAIGAFNAAGIPCNLIRTSIGYSEIPL